MKFVKRYNGLASLVASSLFLMLGACNKEINAVHPYNQIDLNGIMGSVAGIQQTAVSNYAALSLMQQNWHNLSEFKGNTVTSASMDPNAADAYNYAQSTISTVNGGFWQNAYQLIISCDFTLQGIQSFVASGQATSLDSITQAKLLHTKGEMFFLRGLTYFHLVRLYGRPYYQDPATNLGVMIKNTPDPTFLPGRSSVQDCYTQIINDLDSAIACMRGTDLNSNVWASKEAAWALLSRVLLYKGGSFGSPDAPSNSLAITYADSVINSGKFALLTGRASFDTLYNNQGGNREMIFATENQDGFPSNGIAGYYAVANGGNTGPAFFPASFTVAPSLWKSFDTLHDYRVDFIQNINGAYLVKKYLVGLVPNYSASDNPTAYFRLAEVYLNRAEAYLKTGNPSSCLSDLNLIRVRAGLTAFTGISGQALEDSLLSERRKELCFEGDASFDAFRNGLSMIRPAGDYQATDFSILPTDNKVILPIPQSEILSNPKLVQNPL